MKPLTGFRITLVILLAVFGWRVFDVWSTHSVMTLGDALLMSLVASCAALLALVLAVLEGR